MVVTVSLLDCAFVHQDGLEEDVNEVLTTSNQLATAICHSFHVRCL